MQSSFRAIVSLGVVLCSVPAGHAADMTAREVTTALFQARAGSPPNFSRKNLSRLDLADLDFKGANLAGADLFGADLSAANLTMANLAGARLDRATITAANFVGADLSGATILRPNVFSTLMLYVHELPTFAGAKMVGAQISGRFDRVSFKGADLTGAFFGAKDPRSEELITARVGLKACDFSDANLRGANLSLNAAQYAKFIGADLRGANLSQANLMEADFTGANLARVDFTGAVLDGATFEAAKGLEWAIGLPGSVVGARP